jgi:hypothetical protein
MDFDVCPLSRNRADYTPESHQPMSFLLFAAWKQGLVRKK